MKINISRHFSLTYLLLLIVSITLLASCQKNNELPTEDPGAKIPKASINVTTTGLKATVTITGKIDNFWFDQDYYNTDGSLPGPKPGIRTRYEIKYDRVTIISNGRQPFEFKRISPYTYEIIYSKEGGNEKATITFEMRSQPGDVREVFQKVF